MDSDDTFKAVEAEKLDSGRGEVIELDWRNFLFTVSNERIAWEKLYEKGEGSSKIPGVLKVAPINNEQREKFRMEREILQEESENESKHESENILEPESEVEPESESEPEPEGEAKGDSADITTSSLVPDSQDILRVKGKTVRFSVSEMLHAPSIPEKRVRAKYRNWFESASLWSKIEEGLRVCQYSYRRTAIYLKRKWQRSGEINPFAYGPSESTIWGWFSSRGVLKPHIVKLTKDLMDADGKDRGPQLPAYVQGPNPPVVHNKLPRGPGALGEFGSSVWSTRSELESKFVDLLQTQCSWGSILNSRIIQVLVIGFLQNSFPKILHENGGPFHVSREWIRQRVSTRLGCSFRSPTTAASKLPENFEIQGYRMALRLSYLIFSHKIPEDLLINMDQTGLHLIPVSGERTYAQKGTKEVVVSDKDDRRQITVADLPRVDMI